MELNCARKYETPQDFNFTKLDLHDLDYMEICEKKKNEKRKQLYSGLSIYFKNVLNSGTRSVVIKDCI